MAALPLSTKRDKEKGKEGRKERDKVLGLNVYSSETLAHLKCS